MVSFTPLAPLRYPLGKAKNDGYRGTDKYPVGEAFRLPRAIRESPLRDARTLSRERHGYRPY